MGLKKKIAANPGTREVPAAQPTPFSRPQPQQEPIQEAPAPQPQEDQRPAAPALDTEDLARRIEARLGPKIEDAVSKMFEQQLYAELDRRFKSIQERLGEFDQINQKEDMRSIVERLSKLEEMQRRVLERPPGIQTVRVCAGCGLAIPQGEQTCPDCSADSGRPLPPKPPNRPRTEPILDDEDGTRPPEPVRARPEPARSREDFPSESEYDLANEEEAQQGSAPDQDDDFEVMQSRPSSGERYDMDRYPSKDEEEVYQDASYREERPPRGRSIDPAEWDRGFVPPERDRDRNYSGRNQNYERAQYQNYGYDPRPRQNTQQQAAYAGYPPQYQQPAPPPPASPAHPICPGCSSSMEFISAYGAWYCRGCKGYLDPSNGQLARVDGGTSQTAAQEQPIPVQEMPKKRFKDSEKTVGDFHAYIEIDPDKEGPQEGAQDENGKKKGFWPFKKK